MRKTKAQPQARFWTWINDGFVRIKINDGQRLYWTTGGPDDEGWHREHQAYELEGTMLHSEIVTEGRDCDGYTSHSAKHWCRIDCLDHIHCEDNNGRTVLTPDWQLVRSRQRDEYAEAMNY